MTNIIKPNIAFFDSGQGGLTVWENILKRFPNLNTQYLGDNARCPYGNKSAETITHYASEAALYLASRNTSLLVVACGTVSSVAVKSLQNIFRFPIIGIVEGFCKYVSDILEDKNRTVAVLGTRFTIKSQRFNDELKLYGIVNVWTRECPLFVNLVEEGISKGPIADSTADMYLWDIPQETKIVMLACTHYPRLIQPIAESIEKRLNRSVIYKSNEGDWVLKRSSVNLEDPIYIVESSFSIIEAVTNYLKLNNNEDRLSQGEKSILCTDSPTQFERVARFFTKVSIPTPEKVEIQP